jgi:hypothetical protein
MSDVEMLPVVLFLDDLAKHLRMSRRSIEKMRRHGCFPIPEMPSLDKRPRWSGEVVKRFIEQGQTGRLLLKRAG